MTMYYSASTSGFYDSEIHEVLPPDAYEITDAYYSSLLEGEGSGKIIKPDIAGRPILADPPPPTPEEAWEEFKYQRAEKVSQIIATTSTGRTFDGDEDSQNRMARAVAVGSPGDTTEWKLADNTTALVTVEELKEALYLAGQEQTRLWMVLPTV